MTVSKLSTGVNALNTKPKCAQKSLSLKTKLNIVKWHEWWTPTPWYMSLPTLVPTVMKNVQGVKQAAEATASSQEAVKDMEWEGARNS